MNLEAFLFSFWWLIFPVGGMLMGLFAMIGHYNHRKDTLRILKSYADQGKDPPAGLLDALKSDEDRAADYGYYGGGGGMFTALAMAFGVAALFMLIGGLIGLATRPRLPPLDKDDM